MRTDRSHGWGHGRAVAGVVGVALAVLLVLPAPGAGAAKGGGKGKPPATTTTTTTTPPPPSVTTLVLYDTSSWAHLGELYATMTANLAGHFGGWTAKPVRQYAAGDLGRHTATVYVGSTYDEPLPATFLDDVLDASRPVLWINDNIWALTARAAARGIDFEATRGWTWTGFLFADAGYSTPIAADRVTYKGRVLDRYVGSGAAPLMGTRSSTATVLATAALADGRVVPWALRSGPLTYVTEVPFAYMNETDRYLAFADLLFDALAPATAERHRALVRLEDINPTTDQAALRAIADELAGRGIRFGVGVSPVYTDNRSTTRLSSSMATTLAYLVAKGGVLVEHGYTHQWSGGVNPYNGTTGDDYEFYRVVENPDATLTYVGPLPEDSLAWVSGRLDASTRAFTGVGLPAPTIFETPHYAGTPNTYRAVRSRFSTRWERSLYVPGLVSGTADPQDTRIAGQFFPYVVTDVYGSTVLPENLGNIEPDPWKIYPRRLPADIEKAARANLVVRDGFASFYFHPDYDLSYLRDTIDRIRAAGYTFADPRTLLP